VILEKVERLSGKAIIPDAEGVAGRGDEAQRTGIANPREGEDGVEAGAKIGVGHASIIPPFPPACQGQSSSFSPLNQRAKRSFSSAGSGAGPDRGRRS
jgi:hypothetical protein